MGQVGQELRQYGVARGPRGPRRRRRRLERRRLRGRRRHGPQRLRRATSPARPSPRPWAGTAPGSRRGTPPARPAPTALDTARARILAGLCEVALVVGADTTPKGFLAPNAGERWDDPDWLRFRLLGMTNPAYFALYARRRMDLYGATQDDFAQVKVKNARHGLDNPYARYRKEVTRRRRQRRAAVVSDPLRLLDICATSDGAAAVDPDQRGLRRPHGLADPVRVIARSRPSRRRFPNTVAWTCPTSSTDSGRRHRRAGADLQGVDRVRRLRGGRHRPRGRRRRRGVRPVHGRSSWTGSRTSGCASAARPRSCSGRGDTTLGGRIPVNPSGGLACFGEAVPAQALAQVLRAHLAACAARRPAARSRAPRSASPPTRASSATGRR